MTDKEVFIKTLQLLRKQQCAYFSNNNKNHFCDCKMRKDNAPLLSGSESGNGCVELSMIISHINKMTDEEYIRFRQWG